MECMWGGVEKAQEGKEGGEILFSRAATEKEGGEKVREKVEEEGEERRRRRGELNTLFIFADSGGGSGSERGEGED